MTKAKSKMLEVMVNDLMKAEGFINTMGIETRNDKDGLWQDDFRPIQDIVMDVVKVVNMNPTIVEDTANNIDKIKTADDLKAFQARYKF